MAVTSAPRLLVREGVQQRFPDVLTPSAIATLEALIPLNRARQQLMRERSARRAERARARRRIDFLDPALKIPGTDIVVGDARDGKFEGSEIPEDLQRQWIQGTGPATKPGASIEAGTRNAAYALLSGADGWMFDGEDALGQIGGMSLQNQRHLRLAFGRDGHFLRVAERVAGEMNEWAKGFLGRPIVEDWRTQLDFTTRMFRPRGLHLDDRHLRDRDGSGYSASIVDAALYIEANHRVLRAEGRSIVLYLPKIQTAEEAALWGAILGALEARAELPPHTIKTYVLVEQLEACFQLMEIRAALGRRFVGFNTGRWDYINSVCDAMAWDPAFQNPNIDAITMTYGYMRRYEDRVRRAVNTPDASGRFALWQGGMEPNIPVGSPEGVADGMRRAVAGAEREQREGASGKWVAHWKMVHIVRPVWEKADQANQLGREFPRLTYTAEDARGLTTVEPAPRTVRGARDLISVAMQYANAFGRGYQAAALKPADFFGNDDVLYLMEDMATGEIRASVLWEWLHKRAPFTEDDAENGVHAGDVLSVPLFARLLAEEHQKLRDARDQDVHDDSKETTLPIAKEIVDRYVRSELKAPWYADLLYINLENEDVGRARRRVDAYFTALAESGRRITDNPDFIPPPPAPSSHLDQEIADLQAWFAGPRFAGIERLHTAREVAEQRGTIRTDYTVARVAAEGFYERLRELYGQGRSITTFGPYSPGQAVAMKRAGIEGIYLGGWATSAKGSVQEDPGPDLASYPLSQVPDEAAPIVRALLTADRNQHHARARMSEEQRRSTPVVDFRPFIIADADTGHGGDAHVRNLVRRFVEVGVPGYHIEDQKPGVKKCGHQGGKVLVAEDEQIKRLSAARYQLDLMGVPGLIVARTDAESATLLDGRGDERDQPFILGATNTDLPTFKAAFLTILRQFYGLGVAELSGHRIYAMCDEEYTAAEAWLGRRGLTALVAETARALAAGEVATVDAAFDTVFARFVDVWQEDAGIKTYGEAVAAVMDFREAEGETFPITSAEWLEYAATASLYAARARAASMHLTATWDCEHSKTPDGYYQVRGGIEYAIAKSLAAAPYADLLWMETKTADLHDARRFADAIHAKFPDKMLAYNLSPSFNWDTTGMGEEEMRQFPEELGKMGYVFNFITYGGHQIDGLAGEEFAAALREQGIVALARLQRQFRLLESPYRTPQTLVGGPRADAALMSLSGRTSSTKAMGKGSTQFQHLVQTEVPPKLLEDWFEAWRRSHPGLGRLKVSLKPHTPGSDVLELAVRSDDNKVLNVVFATIHDRRRRSILSIRDQNTFDPALRRKRLMTLAQLFLIHRYDADAVHFVTPSADNQLQSEGMKTRQIFASVAHEVGEIIVAEVDKAGVKALVAPGSAGFAAIVGP